MKNKSWRLGDAIKLIDKIPHKFSKPSKNAIEPLEKGHKVKLIFNFNNDKSDTPSHELLWVEILLVENNKFMGQLEDDPINIQDLRRGEIIEFEERHILDTD